jgi:hypothetical protein
VKPASGEAGVKALLESSAQVGIILVQQFNSEPL